MLSRLSSGFDLSFLKLYFRFRSIDLVDRYNIVRGLGLLDPGLAVDLSFLDTLHPFLNDGSLFFFGLMDDFLILLNTVDHGIVRLFFHCNIGVVVPLFVRRVMVDHRIVDDRHRLVVVDDGGAADVGHPDIPVIVHPVEIVLVDHDGMVCISIITDVDVDLRDVYIGDDHRMRTSPVTVAVVRLARRQGHPPHMASRVNPGNPSRIPEESDVEEREPDAYTDHRRGPVPVLPCINPVSVMVGDIAEWFRWNPGLIPIPVGPATDGERRPAHGDTRPPKPAPLAIVGNIFPTSIFFKYISLVPETRRKVFDRPSPHPGLRRPKVFADHVPPVPVRIDGSLARRHLLLVGKDRRGTGRNFVPGIRSRVDEIHSPLDSDRFHRVFANVKVEDRAGIRQNVPEWTRNLDDRVGAFVVEPGHPRSNVHFRYVRIEGDELDLRAVPDPDTGPVGDDQLRHPLASR